MSSGRIVVGVDGSSSATRALQWAARQAEVTGAELDVVSAWNWAATYGYVPVTHARCPVVVVRDAED
jgi:nucleotide-binding universal stress UspA family protein